LLKKMILSTMILSIIYCATLLSVWDRLNRPYRAEIDLVVYT